jgi:hypothetical protein
MGQFMYPTGGSLTATFTWAARRVVTYAVPLEVGEI